MLFDIQGRLHAESLLVALYRQTVWRMKQEILHDMRSGVVPKEAASFGRLHDYVDANEYGGFCEDGNTGVDFGGLLEACFGGHVYSYQTDDTPGLLQDFVNECQNDVDRWLAKGEHLSMLEG